MFNNSEKVFVDRSAFCALLDSSDQFHKEASEMWQYLLTSSITLVTTNYVVSETSHILQNKFGFEATRLWYRDILGVFNFLWIDEDSHRKAYELWMNLGHGEMSLVECASFIIMSEHQIQKVFCFNSCFIRQGFENIC